jgi:predicted nucleic acid-binding protein
MSRCPLDPSATSPAIASLDGTDTGRSCKQEFYVATSTKLGVDPLAAKSVLKTFRVFEIVQTSPDLIEDAIDCAILNKLNFWDALILSAAAAAACETLMSEDFSPGQKILGVRVQNPFS